MAGNVAARNAGPGSPRTEGLGLAQFRQLWVRVHGVNMVGWLGPQVEGGNYYMYCVTGEVLDLPQAEMQKVLLSDDQVEAAGKDLRGIPRSVEHSIKEILQSAGPGKLLTAAEWGQAVARDSMRLYARFFCEQCRKERRIKASYGDRVDRRLAAGPLFCADAGGNCQQPFLAEPQLEATIAEPSGRHDPPEWVEKILRQ